MFLGHLSLLDSQQPHFNSHVMQPYGDPIGITILGDIHLIERETLLEKLGLRDTKNDLDLVLKAYQKWGVHCLNHLVGFFVFVLWDERQKELLIATDHNGSRPCFYALLPNQYIYVSDSFKAIKNSISTLSINQNMFIHFALNSMPGEETCYKEIVKLPAAHYLLIGHKKIIIKRYWSLLDSQQTLSCKTREDYYAAFQNVFTRSVNDCLRPGINIAAHISGGLDSSSVASVAAQLLSAQDQTLYGFTALPRLLSGPSYRTHWQYHEMPKVQAILDQYPNIQHYGYFSDPKINIFETIVPFYTEMDQPCWSIYNLDWLLGSIQYAAQNKCSILLKGTKGNATISWMGQSRRELLRNIPEYIKNYFGQSRAAHDYASILNPKFLQSNIAKNILCNRGLYLNDHRHMLTRPDYWQRISGIRPLATHHGVDMLDPTSTVPIQQFCYHVPQWVYHRPGGGRLNRRLLVREGLSSTVPESVRKNPHRGEQGADWYVSYNAHRAALLQKLQDLSPETHDMLWSLYDRGTVMAWLKQEQPISTQNQERVHNLRHRLSSCLSAGFFYESLV